MVNLPVIRSFAVKNYGLYPGSETSPGLDLKFGPGMTLILGTNGLGKTTLIQMMYRMMSGPFDIPGIAEREELGNQRLVVTKLNGPRKSTFASRDLNRAKSSIANIRFTVGSNEIYLERRLSDLELVVCKINGLNHDLAELHYQSELQALVGLGSFGDFILLLRNLVFYFEDRRSLVWDPTAQRQLLRLLFLTPKVAGEWTVREREILELDSQMRNLRASVYKAEEIASNYEAKESTAEDIREELRSLQDLQRQDAEKSGEFQQNLDELDRHRHDLRLNSLRVKEEADGIRRNFERAKVAAIQTQFPTERQTAAFLLAQLLTENQCLVCQHNPDPEIIKAYEERIAETRCVICNSSLSSDFQPGQEFAGHDLQANYRALQTIQARRAVSESELLRAEEAFNTELENFTALDVVISDRRQKIDSLIRRLPVEENERRQQLEELQGLRRLLAKQQRELESLRSSFSSFLDEQNQLINLFSSQVKETFAGFAKDFLIENCTLSWSPYRSTLGQGGLAMLFPNYGLELSGAGQLDLTRRSSPQEVSQSQREFIDLAFRMSLMSTAAVSGGAATLVVDAPETSLDAVFTIRAAEVLGRFGKALPENRLVITSNLIAGDLIPELIKKGAAQEEPVHVVNLLEIAASTAAVRQFRREYDEMFSKLVEESNA